MTRRLWLVNLVQLDPPRNGGLSRQAREVSRVVHSLALERGDDVVYAVRPSFAGAFPSWSGVAGGTVVPCPPDSHALGLVRSIEPDIIVSPLFGADPFLSADDLTRPQLASMPDALALDRPELFTRAELTARREVYAALSRVTRVVTLSEYARERLVRRGVVDATRISVIPLGADERLRVPAERPGVAEPFVYYPANDWAHKRHPLLFEVMSTIWRRRPDLHLVLSGSHRAGFVEAFVPAGEGRVRVHDLGFVSEANVRWLYEHAEALLYLSEYEGFGMPIIEAMTYGCPVLCSPTSALPEAAGDAALYVDSATPSAWAHAFLDELPSRRDELTRRGRERARRFLWQDVRKRWNAELIALIESRPADSRTQHMDPSVVAQSLAALHPSRAGAYGAAPRLVRRIGRSIPHRYRRAARDLAAAARQAARPRLATLMQYPPRPLRQPRAASGPVPEEAPTIALVTPSLNQAPFIERTIESVRAQQYQCVQLVVEDGGSADGTVEVLRRHHAFLHAWESAPDEGQASAINRGFARTSGEIMAYLNADDILLSGALDRVARAFSQDTSLDVVYSHRVLIDAYEREIGRWILPPHQPAAFAWLDFVPQETLFWRRSIWERAGGGLDESLHFAMDWDLLFRFQAAGATFARLDTFLAAFRVHGSQKTIADPELGRREVALVFERHTGRMFSRAHARRKVRSYAFKHLVYSHLFRAGIVAR